MTAINFEDINDDNYTQVRVVIAAVRKLHRGWQPPR